MFIVHSVLLWIHGDFLSSRVMLGGSRYPLDNKVTYSLYIIIILIYFVYIIHSLPLNLRGTFHVLLCYWGHRCKGLGRVPQHISDIYVYLVMWRYSKQLFLYVCSYWIALLNFELTLVLIFDLFASQFFFNIYPAPSLEAVIRSQDDL